MSNILFFAIDISETTHYLFRLLMFPADCTRYENSIPCHDRINVRRGGNNYPPIFSMARVFWSETQPSPSPEQSIPCSIGFSLTAVSIIFTMASSPMSMR